MFRGKHFTARSLWIPGSPLNYELGTDAYSVPRRRGSVHGIRECASSVPACVRHHLSRGAQRERLARGCRRISGHRVRLSSALREGRPEHDALREEARGCDILRTSLSADPDGARVTT